VSVAPFFDRVVTAIGRHLTIQRSDLEARLAGVAPGIECSEQGTAAAWTNELLANMLARLYPRIVIFGDRRTADTCRALACSINPNIELAERPGDASLVVSTVATTTSATTLAVGSRGWSAFLAGDAPPASGAPDNVFAAAVAAALGARESFRRLVVQADSPERPVQLNLLTLKTGPPDAHADSAPVITDLGHTLIAGVGAVGDAALWCLRRHKDVSGTVYVIDPEEIELSNLQRYVLARISDCDLPKTELTKRELEGTRLRVCELEGRLGDVRVPEEIENILVSVDNVEGRRIAQSLLPRLVINGSTSDTGCGVSWHDFARGGGCLCCVYHPPGPLPSEIELIAKAVGLPPARVANLVLTPGQSHLNLTR
jgi:hypothetical protein